MFEKDYFWNPTTYRCKNGKYKGNIIGDSVFTCNELIDTTKTVATKIIPEKPVPAKCTLRNFHVLYFYVLVNFYIYISIFYDALMKSVNLDDIVILNIKGADYCCIINGISKSDTAIILQNTDLTKKRGLLKK